METRFALYGSLCCAALAGVVCAGGSPGMQRNAHPGEATLARLKEQKLYTSLTEAFTAARYRVEPAGADYVAENPAHALRARFKREGVNLVHASRGSGRRKAAGSRAQDHRSLGRIELATAAQSSHSALRNTQVTLTAVGRGGHLTPTTATALRTRENRVEYTHRTAEGTRLTEWYVNAPTGLEHGFFLKDEVRGMKEEPGPLTLQLGLDTDLHPEAGGDGQRIILRDEAGEAALAYEKLKVWDATGRVLPARMQLVTVAASGPRGSEYASRTTQYAPSVNREESPYTLKLTVDDAAATYPLTIDPTWSQQQKLVAGDGADFDAFGISVAVSGDTAMVGAFQHSVNEGAVYVFERTGTTWSFAQKLTGNDPGELQLFGSSVALEGDTAVIGAQVADTLLGAAHVFVRSGGTWTEQQKLTASTRNIGDFFGNSVALDGDTIVVGANGDSGQGAAYVYVWNGATWSEQQKLVATDPSGADGFGWSVDVSGDIALVSARFHAHGGATDSGSAYVFVRTGTTWTPEAELGVGTFSAGDEAGVGIALDGDTAVVGAWGADDPGLVDAGAVYVYTRFGTAWGQQARLVTSDAAASDGFGLGIALEGNTLAAGATFDAASAGAVYLFTRTGATWLEQQKLVVGDAAADDTFGTSVALSGTTVIGGAPAKSDSRGAAYVFFAPPDPPVISDVRTTSVGQTTATIAWTTDVAASSTVEYRVLGAGAYSTATGSAGTSHTVTLPGLTAGRTYEYRVRSISSGGSAPGSETVYPASGTLQFLTAPSLAGEVLGLGLRRLAGTIYATVTYSNASGASRSGVQLDFGILSGSSTVNTTTPVPASLGTVGAGSSATTTLEFSGGAGVSGSTAVITVGHSSSGGGSSSSYRVTLP